MKTKIGFVHTTPATIGMVNGFMKEYIPDAAIVHMYDGNVKTDNFKNPPGETPKANLRCYVRIAGELEQAGCDIIVSCCSLMPRAAEYAAQAVDIPFVQLDAPILDAAAEYSRVGVVNTTKHTSPYITEQLEKRAAALGKSISIAFSDTTEALELFDAGDYERHDGIVIETMRALEKKGVDCILMGQIPMGLMEKKIAAEKFSVPVLVPGKAAFEHLKTIINEIKGVKCYVY